MRISDWSSDVCSSDLEAFPCDHSDRLDTQHGPHRHFDSTGIRTRHNANAMRIRHAKHFTGEVDGELKAVLAQLRAVRAAKRIRGQLFGRPARGLCAGARRKKGSAEERRVGKERVRK